MKNMTQHYSSVAEFSRFLSSKKKIWRRNVHANSVGSKRHYRDLIRRQVRAFRSIFGSAEVPKAAHAASAGLWTSIPFDQMHIILPAEQHRRSERERETDRDARRTLRRAVRTTLVGDRGSLELVSAKNVDAGRNSLVARSARSGNGSIRGLYFERLGVAVVPPLTSEQVQELEGEGLVVMKNEPVVLDRPTPEAGSQSAAYSTWHLSAVGIDATKPRRFTGKGVTIGVLDTGIDQSHPEFEDKNVDFCEFDQNGLPKTTAAIDYDVHGTHVSALSAGRNVGVAPEASLAVAAVMTEMQDGKMIGYDAQILGGLNWLASKAGRDGIGVDIINASLGSSGAEKRYFGAFLPHHADGRLIVASIGNEGDEGAGTHLDPARYDFVIGVGACDRNNNMATFSAWGRTYPQNGDDHKPDLVAPGVAVESALPQGRYGCMDGTSMASPIVAGAAALLIEHNESLRGDSIGLKQRILELTCALPTTAHNRNAKRFGRGRLDLSLM
ncbi:S8 family serine peptidase (plasmid) [Rhizobium sp. BG6]|nr:S8 family serine peptidase [Rhizobium sp. BG6]